MKKLFLIPAALFILSACGNNTEEGQTGTDTTTTTTSAEETGSLSDNPLYQQGLALEAKNDCATCHKVDERLVGPAFTEIANKYASMPDTIVNHLAHKIIAGGSGVWGEAVMTPHPSLSEADAETLVHYIFLHKK
jgi:cytochrome c